MNALCVADQRRYVIINGRRIRHDPIMALEFIGRAFECVRVSHSRDQPCVKHERLKFNCDLSLMRHNHGDKRIPRTAGRRSNLESRYCVGNCTGHMLFSTFQCNEFLTDASTDLLWNATQFYIFISAAKFSLSSTSILIYDITIMLPSVSSRRNCHHENGLHKIADLNYTVLKNRQFFRRPEQ